MTLRIIAVDWSGAKTGAARKIWLAEAREGVLLRLEGGRDRAELVRELIELKRGGDQLVVGLDFGFSFPAWFMRERGFASASDAWRWLSEAGCADEVLATCEPPFWGAAAKRRPDGVCQYRRTEFAVQASESVRPKSVFQIGGAGAVGTGSIRGMCALHELHDAGCAVWPFNEASGTTAIEIYPRLFTGRLNKSSEEARRGYVEALRPVMPQAAHDAAIKSDDAFDAAVSAIAMSKHASELAGLPQVNDAGLQLEGIIWWPGWREAQRLAVDAAAGAG
jgi:hypothetical protein